MTDVELTRALAIGHVVDPVVLLIHAAYLIVMTAIGTVLAFRTFRNRLVV